MFRREKVYIMFYFFMLDMEIFTSDESGYVPAITKKRNWREFREWIFLLIKHKTLTLSHNLILWWLNVLYI